MYQKLSKNLLKVINFSRLKINIYLILFMSEKKKNDNENDVDNRQEIDAERRITASELKLEDMKYKVLPDDFTKYDISFKMIIIGDPGVGKSCLTLKATKNYFEDFYSTTVGFEFFTFNVQIENKYIKLQIWDTCGQEIYRSLISSFYKNSSLAMMVYQIDSMESFNNISNWLKEIKSQSSPDIKIFLVGNKADQEDRRKVPEETAENFKKENNIDFFVETSAKTGLNVKEVFVQAAKVLYLENLN